MRTKEPKDECERRTLPGEFWMAPKHLVQYGHRPDAGGGLNQRDDLGVKDRGQGIGTATPARGLLLRWQSLVPFDAIGSGGAEPGARRRRAGAPSWSLYFM
jgi:hypothetical protein